MVRHLSAPKAGLRPARPPRGSSHVAKPHLLEKPAAAGRRPGGAVAYARIRHCITAVSYPRSLP